MSIQKDKKFSVSTNKTEIDKNIDTVLGCSSRLKKRYLMDEKELRIWLAGSLNRDGVPDRVWSVLYSRAYVAAVLQGRMSRQILAEYARELLAFSDIIELVSTPFEEDEDQETVSEPLRLTDYEEARAKAFGEYLALRAGMHPHVRNFREMVLNDAVLSDELVRQLQDSPHRWPELISEQWHEISKEEKVGTKLKGVGEELSREFHGYWTVEEAIQFVVADKVVWREPISMETNAPVDDPSSYGTITFKIEPWIPKETLLKWYQQQQRQMLRSKPRVLAARNFNVAAFVFSQLRTLWYEQIRYLEASFREDDIFTIWYKAIAREYPLKDHSRLLDGPLWEVLMERWNKANPKNRYKNEKQFNRDFYRAARTVVEPFAFVR